MSDRHRHKTGRKWKEMNENNYLFQVSILLKPFNKAKEIISASRLERKERNVAYSL